MTRALKIAGLALEGLRRTPLRVTLTALGVAIASASLVAMMAFALGLRRQVEAPFRALALLNNIQVTPKEGEAGDRRVLDDATLARMAQIPGVAAAYPDIRVRGVRLRRGDKSEVAFAMGIPREAALFGIEADLVVAGRLLGQGNEPEAVVGTTLVRGLGFASPQEAIGKRLTMEAAGLLPEDEKTFTFQRKKLEVTVVGVYEAPAVLPGPARRGIFLPIDLMKEVPGARFDALLGHGKSAAGTSAVGYPTATVRVRNPSDLAAVEREIREMGFHTRAVLSRLREMQTLFVFLQVLLAAVGSVALVVAALGITNTLLMSVLERYEEIGLYKAIGASDGDLFVLFLTEAAAIGLLGALGGLAIGRLVSWGLEVAANVYARSQGTSEHLSLFAFPFWLLAATVLFAVAISVLAGVYPALRAARVDPIRALRKE